MQGLSAEQVEALRRELLALAERIETLLASPGASAKPVSLDEPIGRISRMDAIAQQSMRSAQRRAEQGRLAQARSALHRITQGDYGECMDCGEEVGFARLEARPETPFCLACQRLREVRD
jgi:DnaK suppressor protein